jgi:hypothetical protein
LAQVVVVAEVLVHWSILVLQQLLELLALEVVEEVLVETHNLTIVALVEVE